MPKQEGIIIVDGQAVGDTYQCAHCGGHFDMVKGSGKLRGYCTKCGHITCGKYECCTCVPFEKKLDLMEKGHPVKL